MNTAEAIAESAHRADLAPILSGANRVSERRMRHAWLPPQPPPRAATLSTKLNTLDQGGTRSRILSG